jgi:predicted transcriptional regulator
VLNKDLISASVPTLSLNDNIYQALQLMADYHVSHLPVISDEKYLGLVSEDQLLNIEEDSNSIERFLNHFNNWLPENRQVLQPISQDLQNKYPTELWKIVAFQ